MNFGIFNKPEVLVYCIPSETKLTEKGILGNVSDQGLYGGGCKIIDTCDQWSRIITDYGYSGWIHSCDITLITAEGIEDYYEADLHTVKATALDVLSAPCVQGAVMITVPGGACLNKIETDKSGWCSVKLIDGQLGYVPEAHLEKRISGVGYLFCDTEDILTQLQKAGERDKTVNGGNDFDFRAFLNDKYNGDEAFFRRALVNTAKSYLGTQYRWGGRSAQGLDCSGLVSITYLRCGVEIYRDASVADGFPLKKLNIGDKSSAFENDEVLRPGDALYFPGHIAMYLGNGKYIHSTGRAGDNGVVINSMHKNAPDYREDLFNSMYAAAGLR